MSDLYCIFEQLSQQSRKRILVLGDIMLDRYTRGDAERVSPEAPVIVLRADQQEVRPGGAASVAYLLRHLEVNVALAGVIGNDSDGHTLRALLRDEGIDEQCVLVDPSRPTTTKHRFVGRASDRHPHQILRVDHESRAALLESTTDELRGRLKDKLPEFDAILIADYLKGVCTESLLQSVIDAARSNGFPVLIDPGRTTDYRRYRGSTLLKPNRVEAELAITSSSNTVGCVGWTSSGSNRSKNEANTVSKPTITDTNQAIQAAAHLRETYQVDSVLITLDRDGMVVVTSTEQVEIVSEPRAVYDITGAGDMVLAALGLCLANGIPVLDAARIANIAAGLEVERFGISPVTRSEIATKLAPAYSNITNKKLLTTDEITQVSSEYRRHGKRIVFTNGCFDLLHVGHVSYLQEAAALGDTLIVAVNSDASVQQLKGPTRPIVPEQDRATLLASLGCVNHVVIFEEQTPIHLIHEIRPDVLVKGGSTQEIVGREIVEAYGGRVCHAGMIEGNSTTQLIEKMQEMNSDTREFLCPELDRPQHKSIETVAVPPSGGAHQKIEIPCTT
ncbi:MAG: rfaE2 [Planctomycetaceae bacterium]|nr:rfaE2 [Planctomycetaceae bacterium]